MSNSQAFSFWHGLLLVETVALVIALATTVVPSRSGSEYGFAAYFYAQPTFMEQFVVNLIATHILFAALALAIGLWWWLNGAREGSTPDK